MSRGQSYVILATDLLRAFFALKLGEIEGSLLVHVIENTWGKTAKRGRKGSDWPDTVPCDIDVTGFMKSFEIKNRQNVYSAIDRLLKSKIMFKTEAGYLVNKDADSWVNPGTSAPRINKPYLEYAASAQRLNVTSGSDKPGAETVTSRSDKTDRNVTSRSDKKSAPVTSGSDKSEGRVTSGSDNALEERTRGNPTGLIQNSPREERNGSHLPEASSLDPQDGIQEDFGRGFDVILDATSKPIHDMVLEATRSASLTVGNPDMADFVVREFNLWLAQGYPAALAREVITKAIKKGTLRSTRAFSNYANATIVGMARDLKSIPKLPDFPKPVPPSQTKPMTYFTGYKRPEPTGGNA